MNTSSLTDIGVDGKATEGAIGLDTSVYSQKKGLLNEYFADIAGAKLKTPPPTPQTLSLTQNQRSALALRNLSRGVFADREPKMERIEGIKTVQQ